MRFSFVGDVHEDDRAWRLDGFQINPDHDPGDEDRSSPIRIVLFGTAERRIHRVTITGAVPV